jgi:alkylation response protein AidB-like acyl-CoA dehydrogenase
MQSTQTLDAEATRGRPAVAQLVERAVAMVATLRERAPLAEELRRIPDETVAEFKAAGLVRMGTPERFGGYGYGLAEIADMVEPIGTGCGSSAWMCSFWPTHQLMVRLFSAQAQAEYWADGPDTLSSTASALVEWTSTPCEGGIRVTGAHKFSSGIDHAEWVILTAPNGDCLVPRSDFTIVDDWYVSGLKGTGSKTIRYEDVFIPEHRIVTHEQSANREYPGKELYPGDPLFEMASLHPVVVPQAILAAVIAMAGGVVERFDTRVRTRRDPASGEPARERHVVQRLFAEATVELDVARMLLRRSLDEVVTNPSAPLPVRARIRRDTTYASQLCVRLVDRLVASGDSSAIYETNHAHRLARDVRAGALQYALGWDEMAVQYSRVHWGLPPHTRLI